LIIGSKISHYKIVEKLGEGGMGVVYKAEDTKLNRQVALKFLAQHLLNDTEAKERFLREAQAAAALHHANICPVYEIDDEDGKTFLAMAFLEGETLEDRIAKGPLSIKDALDIARQVADGLQAAHEKNVVHRDIKPANILVDAKGHATIMDFGLARLTEASRLTKVDTAMGTVAYMSPEQAQGMDVDHRSDVWSLGCVLYEMVSGQRPFLGQYDQALLYEIVHEEVAPLTSVRAGVPMELEFIAGKCLAKDAADRYQHASDIAVDLRTLGDKLRSGRSTILRTANTGLAAHATANAAQTMNPALVPPQSSPSRKWQVLAGVLAVALLAVSFAYFSAPAPDPGPQDLRRFSFSHANDIGTASISPDGRNVVFNARGENSALWLRSMGSETLRELRGTEGAGSNVTGWSPDSRSIVFGANGQLKRVAVDGGDPVVLCPLSRQIDRRAGFGLIGASFSPDGNRIVFSLGGELFEVSALGGEPKRLFETEPNTDYFYPLFLPTSDDRQLLIYSMREDRNDSRTAAMDLETGERHEVGPFTAAVYAPSGYLIHEAANGLAATPFSLATVSTVGESIPLATSGSTPSVSRDGTLVYTDTEPTPGRVVVRDRSGQIVQTVGEAFATGGAPAVSPDGSRVAINIAGEIWIHDLERETAMRLPSSQGEHVAPSWLSSGRELSFETVGSGVWVQAADGNQPATLAIPRLDGAGAGAASWSLDGRYVSYSGADPTGGEGGIWYREIGPDGALSEPITFLRTPFQEYMSQISPNGRYIAYVSNELGSHQLYVRSFPDPTLKWQISTERGWAPRWSADGTQLFYKQGSALFAVDVSTSGAFTAGRPRQLFETPNLEGGIQIHQYDVFPDGQRFVMIDRGKPRDTIRIVQNWDAPFRAREQ
jgi:serine/threonine protein kinase/Tol biopolymer transport system component